MAHTTSTGCKASAASASGAGAAHRAARRVEGAQPPRRVPAGPPAGGHRRAHRRRGGGGGAGAGDGRGAGVGQAGLDSTTAMLSTRNQNHWVGSQELSLSPRKLCSQIRIIGRLHQTLELLPFSEVDFPPIFVFLPPPSPDGWIDFFWILFCLVVPGHFIFWLGWVAFDCTFAPPLKCPPLPKTAWHGWRSRLAPCDLYYPCPWRTLALVPLAFPPHRGTACGCVSQPPYPAYQRRWRLNST